MRFILQINLKTGQQLPVYREQVDQGLIELARAMLPLAIDSYAVYMANSAAGIQGHEISIVPYGSKCCVCDIDGNDHNSVAKVYIAGHSKCGSRLWNTFINHGSQCPPEPYLAYRWHVDPIEPLQEFIKALSFSWMDSLKKR